MTDCQSSEFRRVVLTCGYIIRIWLGIDCSATRVGTKKGVDINFGAICKTHLTTGHDGHK